MNGTIAKKMQMSSETHKLLLTAAGTGTAYSYALAKAKWFPNIVLFTGDINVAEQVTASVFADEHIVLPRFDENGFLDSVENQIRSNAIDSYIPLIDGEVVLAAEAANRLTVRVASNGLAFCRAAIAKSRYAELIGDVPMSVPKKLEVTALPGLSRFIAKKDGGFGGRATQILSFEAFESGDFDEKWHFYEYVEGPEYTVDCFPARGEVFTSVRQRLEVKSGVCTKARILDEPPLSAFAQHLVEYFSLSHPFCFQTRCHEGRHYLIDINPRLGAGTAMSAANGMDFFSAHLAQLMGDDPLRYLSPLHAECIVTRQYTEYLMSGSS
ncbi:MULTISPECIES: ATP-grasp domain-containing protein [Pseudomonas]|uniref:ATP-grasp domain-containing protein n=1 Tax=Pseudomonas TaxID=286 RepID=UPI00257EDB37|nr:MULTISPECIES: ATP-grasp domain-containing protein [Pseudomonas]